MNKITIKIGYVNLWYEEFQKYILGLNGVINIINDSIDDEIITIEYNNEISLKVIIKEIMLYLDLGFLSILYFNKYIETKLDKLEFNIEHLCCEYCLSSNIEELLYMDGISEIYTNFNKDLHNVLVCIYYDKDKVNEEQLSKMEEKFNK